MAAPARRSTPDPYARTFPVRERPKVVVGGGQRIRWDRLSRMALLVLLVGMVGLYVGPLSSFWSARGDAAGKRAQVERLQRENAKLRARREALQTAGAIEAEARRLGMVRPGERPFIVEGLTGK